MPIGRIGNPESMDHPKDQPLCLVLDFLGHVLLMFCSCVFVERVSEKNILSASWDGNTSSHLGFYGCFQKLGDFTPKMDGENNGNPY